LGAQRRLALRPSTNSFLGPAQRFDAFFKADTFVVRQGRVEDLEAALTSDDARQRQRHAKLWIVNPDRNHRALVAQHDLGDPGANQSNSVLAGSYALDDCYICVANFILDRLGEIFVALK